MLKELAEFLYKKVLWHIGDSPESSDSKGNGNHSLKGLEKLGYPYSKKKNNDPHKSKGMYIHFQKGDFYDSVAKKTPEEFIEILEKKVYINIYSNSPEWVHLKFGTSKMIPRDLSIFIFEKYRKEILDIIKKYWKEVKI